MIDINLSIAIATGLAVYSFFISFAWLWAVYVAGENKAALGRIIAETERVKNGTGRKINRLAREWMR